MEMCEWPGFVDLTLEMGYDVIVFDINRVVEMISFAMAVGLSLGFPNC